MNKSQFLIILVLGFLSLLILHLSFADSTAPAHWEGTPWTFPFLPHMSLLRRVP